MKSLVCTVFVFVLSFGNCFAQNETNIVSCQAGKFSFLLSHPSSLLISDFAVNQTQDFVMVNIGFTSSRNPYITIPVFVKLSKSMLKNNFEFETSITSFYQKSLKVVVSTTLADTFLIRVNSDLF